MGKVLDNSLFGRDAFPFYGFLVVWTSASGTQIVQIILDIVIAELTDLNFDVSNFQQRGRNKEADSECNLPGNHKDKA